VQERIGIGIDSPLDGKSIVNFVCISRGPELEPSVLVVEVTLGLELYWIARAIVSRGASN